MAAIAKPSRRRRSAAWLAAGLAAALIASPAARAQAVKDEPKAKADAKPAAKKAARYEVPPTYANVHYGDHERQVLDFFKADSPTPTPLVVNIHGGGWVAGDKVGVGGLKRYLANGISVASINYRYIKQAEEQGLKPPVKGPLEDAARAIQFLRSKAGEWNIDKTKIAATGGSAGACSSLWLAFHDDMAKPDSPDPVARESTRLFTAAVSGAQTSLEPKQLREWIPNMRYGGHAFGFSGPGGNGRDSQFQKFYDHRDEVADWIKEYSPIAHVTRDDPPIFMIYPAQDKPPVKGEEQKDPTHTALLGLILEEKLKAEGVESRLDYIGRKDPEFPDIPSYLIAKLKPAKP
ncbi:alpha/beta hydrolase family protein [Paludisphaera rhizosphaerae]|uniref:alpha/beta hydrolase family protein n=1 Tax=Paludisphaera rhizosphaerae TaxID=2711216 RepID=UPI0021BC7533|nr:alpha/beta hydrolase [Paludisphaera rhizosphaerae]